jgi:hypothetical protein
MQIDVEHLVPVRGLVLVQRCGHRVGDARVVEQNVDASERLGSSGE